MVGDVSAEGGGGLAWLRWLSPFGWLQRTDPFGADRPLPLLLVLAATAALVAAVAIVRERRDLGGGLLVPSPGPPAATPSLRSPLALARRLHRATLRVWAVGVAAVGVLLGALTGGVDALVEDTPSVGESLDRLGGSGSVRDAYLSVIASLFGLLAAGLAVQVLLRLHEEEASGRAELLLSRPVPRRTWALAHLAVAAIAPAVVLVIGGIALGLAAPGGPDGRLDTTLRTLSACLVQLPAAWLVLGVALAVVGRVPRAVAGTWAFLGWCVTVYLVGALVDLGSWFRDLSPFTHVPHLPGGEVRVLPMALLVAGAAALAVFGLAALDRRDLPAG